MDLEDTFFNGEKGKRASSIVSLNGRTYAMGIQVSNGYREYKREDGYINDVLCMVFVPI
jgi:hypothetical protein